MPWFVARSARFAIILLRSRSNSLPICALSYIPEYDRTHMWESKLSLELPHMSGCVSTPTHAAYDAASIMSSCAAT